MFGRRSTLAQVLPEALDVLALVMQAGLDFQSALRHYVEHAPHDPLSEAFQSVLNDIQLGKHRVEALRGLAARTEDLALRDTLRMVIQGLELGTSLTPLLKQQALAVRRKRAYDAERKAALVPLKLMLPLFVFIFPTLFLILFGPLWVSFQAGTL